MGRATCASFRSATQTRCRCTTQEIAALKLPAITVGKVAELLAVGGIEGLREHKVQARVCQQPDKQSRWSVRTLAAELVLPSSTVQGMLLAAKLQPIRIRTFTFSLDLILRPSC